MIKIKNKKILLLGLGLHGGGVATAKWLYRHGACLIISDLKNKSVLAPSLRKLKLEIPRQARLIGGQARDDNRIKYVLGKHRQQDVRWADIVIQNPGVPSESKYIKLARKLKKPVLNEASLFFDRVKSSVIGVTGTRGKSTTAAYLAEILHSENKKTIAIGNIRTKAMLAVLDLWPRQIPLVAELSSWQLEGLDAVKTAPTIAIVTNLYPDHLNRYRSLRDYYNSKKLIFKYQNEGDFLVLNAADKTMRHWAAEAKARVIFFAKKDHGQLGVFIKNNHFVARLEDGEHLMAKLSDFKQAGAHNLDNMLAALAAALAYGVKTAAVRKTLNKPPQLSGRQEVIAKKQGITFVNDTTATTPEAGTAALERFGDPGRNIILIAGGADKLLDYKKWGKAVKKYCKYIFLLAGDASVKMAHALSSLKNKKIGYNNLSKLLADAMPLAKKGDIILFSPAAASFNLWNHEFARGDEFEKVVRNLRI